ncbi:hypothetical protein ABN356_02790 [Providencia rettgeri]
MPHIRLHFRTPTEQDIEGIIERVNNEMFGCPLNAETAKASEDLAVKYAMEMISVESEFVR